MKMSDYVAEIVKIRAMIKGPPGVGKTYVMACLSRLFPMLIVDCEGGLASAKGVVDNDRLEIISVRPPSMGAFKRDPEETFFRPLAAAVQEGLKNEKYQAIGIDSFSEISAMMRDQYANREGSVGVQDWQKVVSRIRGFSRLIKDAGKHVIITCMTKPIGGDDADGPRAFEPALPGATANEVPGMFDLVGMVSMIRKGNDIARELVVSGPQSYGVRDRNNIFEARESIDADHPEALWNKYVQRLTGGAKQEKKEE